LKLPLKPAQSPIPPPAGGFVSAQKWQAGYANAAPRPIAGHVMPGRGVLHPGVAPVATPGAFEKPAVQKNCAVHNFLLEPSAAPGYVPFRAVQRSGWLRLPKQGGGAEIGPLAFDRRTTMNEKHIGDLAAFNSANLEAVTASGKIWAAGVTDLTNQVAGSARSTLDETVATFRALTGVKSVREAINIQGSYGKAAFASAMAMSRNLTEASIKLTEQAMVPLTARLAVAVESLSKAA
jgi:phasin family protein